LLCLGFARDLKRHWLTHAMLLSLRARSIAILDASRTPSPPSTRISVGLEIPAARATIACVNRSSARRIRTQVANFTCSGFDILAR
jgi:hypothetical protein